MMLNRLGRGCFGDYGYPFIETFGGWRYLMAGGAIVLILALIAIFVLVTKRRSKLDDSAMEILKERFASGEIDQEEYERKRKLLK